MQLEPSPYRAKIAQFAGIIGRCLEMLAKSDIAAKDETLQFGLSRRTIKELLLEIGDGQISWMIVNGECARHGMLGYCGAIVEINSITLHINIVDRTSELKKCNFLKVNADNKATQEEVDRYAAASRQIYVRAEYSLLEKEGRILTPKKVANTVDDWEDCVLIKF